MNKTRDRKQILEDVKNLINTKGYIYALCLILFENFYTTIEEVQEVEGKSRLNIKEASLLLGFFIQNEIDFSIPDTPQDLIALKQKTYELMHELHQSFSVLFSEKLQEDLNKENKIENYRKNQKEFFGKGDMLIEPILYSDTGVYDFQYLDFLEKKYKYDNKWLLENKNFDIKQAGSIAIQIKSILEEKAQKIHADNLKEKIPQVVEILKKEYPREDWEKYAKEIIPRIELYPYKDLFSDPSLDEGRLSGNENNKNVWKAFCKELLELFTIRKADFNKNSGVNAFIENFLSIPKKGANSLFQGVGDFNWFNAKPIIKLDKERYFIPISFSVFEAVYESPFYWMWEDTDYRDTLGENRGVTGEEITYEFLSQVFGRNNTFKSVKITSQKGRDDTDIDILCILGNKALCVQVKSKKLTVLSRTGDDDQLQKDFQGAVQDAYKQGLLSRQKILNRSAIFFDEEGRSIRLPEEIDEVYIMGITTENYPSLTHQAHVMLDKDNEEPFPIFSTIFDLELMTHYLSDPYDFLYYIKQRTSLMDFFKADEEIVFLGYHLDQKLWRVPGVDMFVINNRFGQLISRDYYLLKTGLNGLNEEKVVNGGYKNEDFDKLCKQLKTLSEVVVTDIIFHLLDWSGEARDYIVDCIIKTKQKTVRDGKFHNCTVLRKNSCYPCIGVTYVSLNLDDSEELKGKLLTLCRVKKYEHKGDVWIGFGSLKSSSRMIDIVIFNKQVWKYDEDLKELTRVILESKNQGG